MEDKVDPQPYLKRIIDSPYIRPPCQNAKRKALFQKDVEYAMTIDIFPFAMEVFCEEGIRVLRPVLPSGILWSKES